MKTPQACNTDLAVIGAYIAEGLFSPPQGDNDGHHFNLLRTSPGGHIGIVIDACAYAEYMRDLRDAAYTVAGDFPGVWEYEVVNTFGRWYGRRLIETEHQQPTPQQVRVYLLNATQAFFTAPAWRCPADEIERMCEALCSVIFMGGKFDD